MTKKEFVNCEWDKMCEVSAQKMADELKKKEALKLQEKAEAQEKKEKEAAFKRNLRNLEAELLGENDSSKDEKMNSEVSVDSVTNHEPPEKKARIEENPGCVPIEEDPNNSLHVPEQENPEGPASDSDSEPETDQPVVEVQLGEYIAAPSGFQTLFHGCELPIHRLIEDANDSEDDEDGQTDTNQGSAASPSGEAKPAGSEIERNGEVNPIESASSGQTSSSPGNKVQNEEKTENPSSLETES